MYGAHLFQQVNQTNIKEELMLTPRVTSSLTSSAVECKFCEMLFWRNNAEHRVNSSVAKKNKQTNWQTPEPSKETVQIQKFREWWATRQLTGPSVCSCTQTHVANHSVHAPLWRASAKRLRLLRRSSDRDSAQWLCTSAGSRMFAPCHCHQSRHHRLNLQPLKTSRIQIKKVSWRQTVTNRKRTCTILLTRQTR